MRLHIRIKILGMFHQYLIPQLVMAG